MQGQCRITGTTAPEKRCYRTEVWSLLSARQPYLEELGVISMEKPRGRILLMLWSDILCLILKGKLMLTVKSISNQDWNLLYDHGQWTPYCWSHKWCHISAALWLPIFSPEIPILIKKFNLKGKVSLADSEKYSFVLLKLCVEQKTAYILLSTILSLWKSPVWRQTYNLQLWKQVWRESWGEHRSWAGFWGWRNVTTCEQHKPKVSWAFQTQLPWD